MMRRCITPLVMLAAILMLAAPPSPVRAAVLISNAADGTPVYHLNNTDALGTSPVSGFLAYVKPPGTLDLDASPLMILPGSSGFTRYGDANDSLFKVAVGDGQVPAGQPNAGDPYQLLAVDFGPDGFAPGGVLNFSLKLNEPVQAVPELTLLPTPPSAPGPRRMTAMRRRRRQRRPPRRAMGAPTCRRRRFPSRSRW